MIIRDSRPPEVDERTRRFFERLKREGTPYVELDRIVDSLLLGPSHHSIGLQAADLVIASTLAARRGQGDASRWHKQLLPSFARHPDTGVVEGVGLVEFRPGRGARQLRRASCSPLEAPAHRLNRSTGLRHARRTAFATLAPTRS